MKILTLGVAVAALAGGVALSPAPAAAGSYFEFGVGPAYHYAPPPPPPRYYSARRAYYYDDVPVYRAPPPRQVCTVRKIREWGPYGPETRRVETCRDRW